MHRTDTTIVRTMYTQHNAAQEQHATASAHGAHRTQVHRTEIIIQVDYVPPVRACKHEQAKHKVNE